MKRILDVTPFVEESTTTTSKKKKKTTTITTTTSKKRKRANTAASPPPTLTALIKWPNITLDAISDCSVEFVQLIMTKANEIATKKRRAITTTSKAVTIVPDDVFEALNVLGFNAYISEAKIASNEMNDMVNKKRKEKLRRQSTKKISMKEAKSLAKEQALLFAAAADAFGGDDE